MNWNYDIISKGNTDIAKQEQLLKKEKLRCIGYTLQVGLNTNVNESTLQCGITWDSAMCWPATDSGTLASLPCAAYVSGFNPKKNATRYCTPEGTWWVNPQTNKTWTNFTMCRLPLDPITEITIPRSFAKHIPYMRVMYNTGYGISMVSLLLAVFIMLYFKRVHCPRNTVHLNLFISFILRAVVSFVRDNILVQSVGFASDVEYLKNGKIIFRTDISHWECRFFFSLFNYIIAASYMWIFVEALYLQMLISISVFSEKSRVKWYMVLGWTMPLVFVIPWVVVRITIDNEFCWNTYYDRPWVIWILFGPITLTLVINICIFANIVRILFTKLSSSPCPETKKLRYRRLAKSTLILIPLFGVYYIVFIYVTFGDIKNEATIVLLYVEMFLNSFQGFILAMLFCFFNTEIQTEFKKAWRRIKLQRGGATRCSFRTKTSFVSRVRNGRDGQRSVDASNGVVVSIKDNVVSQDITLSPTSDIIPLKDNVTYSQKDEHINRNAITNLDLISDLKIDEHTPCLNHNDPCEEQSTHDMEDYTAR